MIRREIYPRVDKRVYRPKQKSMDKLQELLPKASEAPDDIPPRWPTWLEDLLSVVHYNFQMGLVFYCVSCTKGLYQEKDFEEAAVHSGHCRLLMYDCQGSICVNWADIEGLGVNTQEIQKFRWSVPGIGSDSLFVFLHNTFGYAYKDLPKATPWKNCAHCRTRLQYVPGWTNTRFCSLDCKFQVMVSNQDSFSPKLISAPPMPRPSDSRLAEMTYAQVTTKGTGYMKSPRGILLADGRKTSGCQETSDSSNRSGEIVHERSVQPVPDVREVEYTGLPEALYEELDVLFSPCEEFLSMQTVTPAHRSLASFQEDILTAGHSSDADSKPVKNPVAQNLCIELSPPECMVPTTRSFHTALAAASCSSNLEKWPCNKTTAVTKNDWDVDGKEMEVEDLGRTRKSLNDNVMRKAASLLRSFGSEFEKLHRIGDEDDTNSNEGSSSSGGTGPEFSIGSPVQVESFKVEGRIDFTSLSQLVLTFDPQSWMSNSPSPVVMPELPPAPTGVR